MYKLPYRFHITGYVLFQSKKSEAAQSIIFGFGFGMVAIDNAYNNKQTKSNKVAKFKILIIV